MVRVRCGWSECGEQVLEVVAAVGFEPDGEVGTPEGGQKVEPTVDSSATRGRWTTRYDANRRRSASSDAGPTSSRAQNTEMPQSG